MKKITIVVLIFLSTVLNSALFDNNTDVKSKYEFNVDQALENEKLAAKLARFQNDEVSEEEIKNYLELRDDNKSVPFKDDVALDESLQSSFPQREVKKEWYISIYEYMFSDAEEEAPVVEDEAPVVEEATVAEEDAPIADEVTPTTEETPVDTNPEQGAQQ